MSERASDDTVTGIIVHEPRPEARAEYERWLDEIREACRRFPGYLSTDVIRPVDGHDSYTVVIRFKGVEQLKACLAALPERRRYPISLHLQGFALQEIADLIGTSAEAARKLVSRGMDELKDRLRELGAGEFDE